MRYYGEPHPEAFHRRDSSLPSRAVEVVDTVGAEDSFTAAVKKLEGKIFMTSIT
jgi:hypothetical protein